MPVDAVLVAGARIEKVVGQSGHHGELMASLRVEIGIARTTVSGTVADAKVREVAGIVVADRDVPHPVNHPVVDA